jgi:hypothetical protein
MDETAVAGLDETAIAALCAVPSGLQGGDAERFFNLIIEMQGNGQTALDELIQQAGQRDPDLVNPATEFSDNLRTRGLDGRWPDIAQMLVSEGSNGAGVAALRDRAAAVAALRDQAGGADGGARPDWGSFCVKNAGFWAGWNGTDWGTWRAAFARLVPGELAAESERDLSYLDDLPPASQLAYLRDNLGFTINGEALAYYQSVDAASSEAEASGDGEAGAAGGPAWKGFCAENAGFWAGWNGTDWGTWRAAFAGLVPGELAAEGERRLRELDGLSPAGQLTYLRGTCGFTINEQALAYHQSAEAAPAAAPEELTPEELAARQPEAEKNVAEVINDVVPDDIAEQITQEDISQLFDEVPELAGASPEEIRELVERAEQASASPE